MNTKIEVNNLVKKFKIYKRPLHRLLQIFSTKPLYQEHIALNDISFKVGSGEIVAVMGKNGCGKSTMLQIIAATKQASSGSVKVNGRVSSILELGAGFNPEFSGRDNIYLNAAIMGIAKDEISQKINSIIDFADIGDFLDREVKTYSSGMYVRLAFAIAVSIDPDILIIDEALSVGDALFQRKCFRRIKDIKENGGTILFVSHSAAAVTDLCDRAILLNDGKIIADDIPRNIVKLYNNLLSRGQDNADISLEYKSSGALISNVRIESTFSGVTKELEIGKSYILKYDVELDDVYDELRFAMMFKNCYGVEIAGSYCYAKKVKNKITVAFEFKCKFAIGEYFINVGCSNNAPLHRIIDAMSFSVIGDDSKFSGMLDIGIKGGYYA